LSSEQVASDGLETFDVVNVLAEKWDPHHRRGLHLSGQIGDVSLLSRGDTEELIEVAEELSVGTWICRCRVRRD
jgi:hypothetical protein